MLLNMSDLNLLSIIMFLMTILLIWVAASSEKRTANIILAMTFVSGAVVFFMAMIAGAGL